MLVEFGKSNLISGRHNPIKIKTSISENKNREAGTNLEIFKLGRSLPLGYYEIIIKYRRRKGLVNLK
jgi:hypothetical protein